MFKLISTKYLLKLYFALFTFFRIVFPTKTYLYAIYSWSHFNRYCLFQFILLNLNCHSSIKISFQDSNWYCKNKVYIHITLNIYNIYKEFLLKCASAKPHMALKFLRTLNAFFKRKKRNLLKDVKGKVIKSWVYIFWEQWLLHWNEKRIKNTNPYFVAADFVRWIR